MERRHGPSADYFAVVPEMKLSPNVGSDRSWVWNAAADVSEGEPEAQTLAIRFANSESKLAFDFERCRAMAKMP
jgi:Ran-binding protein 1